MERAGEETLETVARRDFRFWRACKSSHEVFWLFPGVSGTRLAWLSARLDDGEPEGVGQCPGMSLVTSREGCGKIAEALFVSSLGS